MKKDTFYFSHDFNSRNDEKILKIRTNFNNAEAYGMFWMLVENMAESTDGTIDGTAIAELSFSLHIPSDKLEQFIAFCIKVELFFELNGRITSKRIQQHKEFRKIKSDAGKKGANVRWPSNSTAIAPIMQSKIKESKVKEKKNIDISNKTLYLTAVYLKEEEYNKLIERFGQEGTQKRIYNLNNGICAHGYKYKSHYHAILSWEAKNERNKLSS